MIYIDHTFNRPEENLAYDEALLESCENETGQEILRIWEPPQHCVVLGYGNKARNEVNQAACKRHQIPILRRPSGGGTVLIGPGCCNYSLILKIDRPELRNITSTNRYVMAKNQSALEPLLGPELSVQGDTDLTMGNLKFSGNSQRRKRRSLLFHGTFLLSLNFEILEALLRHPVRQPEYRKNRPHHAFLMNLNLPPQLIKERMKEVWGAQKTTEIPSLALEDLMTNRYSRKDWNLKF